MRTVDRLVLGWVRLYTAGLDHATARARRDEILSDLWEHRRWASRSGRRAPGPAIVGRAVRGAPADLVWRHAAGDLRGVRRAGLGVAWALAVPAGALLALTPVIVLHNYLSSPEVWGERAWIVATATLALGLLLQATGLVVAIGSRRAGLAVAAAGMWTVVAVFWWAWLVGIPAGLLATWALHRLARHRPAAGPPPPSAATAAD